MQNTIRRFCNKVDAIIAPSASIKNYLQLHKVITPIMIIPSPLRECFINSVDNVTEAKNSEFFELLLVTRFVPEKNIPFVFKVMQLLPNNFRLTLAGYGNDAEKLQTLAFNTLQLSTDRIHFIHKPDQKKIVELYRKAYLFIFPSQTDTQGIVLAESMSQALPVIALDGPGQRDIIINGVNGFITANEQNTAEIILQISADKKLYNHLTSGAQKTALNYNAQINTQNLITLYHSIKT
jgi:glycosyltransferase involved in cell wall biosynthesis